MTTPIDLAIEAARVSGAFHAGKNFAIAELLNQSDGHTLLGRPVRFSVEWPNGEPPEPLLRGYIESALRADERYAP
jgi:hypothetical protein